MKRLTHRQGDEAMTPQAQRHIGDAARHAGWIALCSAIAGSALLLISAFTC